MFPPSTVNVQNRLQWWNNWGIITIVLGESNPSEVGMRYWEGQKQSFQCSAVQCKHFPKFCPSPHTRKWQNILRFVFVLVATSYQKYFICYVILELRFCICAFVLLCFTHWNNDFDVLAPIFFLNKNTYTMRKYHWQANIHLLHLCIYIFFSVFELNKCLKWKFEK